MLSWLRGKISNRIIGYLDKTTGQYQPFAITAPETLEACLRPGDVLLVEGNKRISAIIKYLTQSTWSHAAFYVGESLGGKAADGSPHVLIEAESEGGVVRAPLSKYASFNTRICRPVELSEEDRQKVVGFMVDSLGKQYDVRNVIDLMRYLIPRPPVPVRWRRRMLALGSGDPTRAICSTLIAQAFQSVRYPILPAIKTRQTDPSVSYTVHEILHIRHHSLFTPRDFDVSPYFAVIKPTLETGFDYKTLVWGEGPVEGEEASPDRKVAGA